MRYEYLVVYAVMGGTGRSFVTQDHPIECREHVESVEQAILANNNAVESLVITNFQLLRCYQDGIK